MSGDVTLVSALERVAGALERLASSLEGFKPAGTSSPAGNGNGPIPPRPAASKPSLTVETVRERLAKWVPDLEIMDGFDGFTVKPKRFLGETWSEVNEVVRSLGGQWISNGKQGYWKVPA